MVSMGHRGLRRTPTVREGVGQAARTATERPLEPRSCVAPPPPSRSGFARMWSSTDSVRYEWEGVKCDSGEKAGAPSPRTAERMRRGETGLRPLRGQSLHGAGGYRMYR